MRAAYSQTSGEYLVASFVPFHNLLGEAAGTSHYRTLVVDVTNNSIELKADPCLR
ncbi:MAG: hypothetical protein ABJO67_03680 [Pseudoruegeria sp.]